MIRKSLELCGGTRFRLTGPGRRRYTVVCPELHPRARRSVRELRARKGNPMKKCLTLLLALALCAGLASPALAAGPSFSDLPASHWAYDSVERAYADGILTGTSYDAGTGERRFSPGSTLTLAEFLTVVARAFYLDEIAPIAPGAAWYGPYVTVAGAHGLTDASLTDADLAHSINRFQMAEIIRRLMADKGAAVSENALAEARARIADWDQVPAQYQEAVAAVFSLGILTGVDSAGTFAGTATMDRAQCAAAYCRITDALFGTGDPGDDPTPAPTPAPDSEEPLLADGTPITDDNIRAIIYGLQKDYPEGMPWTNDNVYTSQAVRVIGHGCEGFALICSDAVFGDYPVSRTHSDFDSIQVGDLLRINHDTHTVIVLEKRADSVIVAEGNYNSSIHWGREISRQSLVDGELVVRTRYPA